VFWTVRHCPEKSHKTTVSLANLLAMAP
jgi:hypothetical protein